MKKLLFSVFIFGFSISFLARSIFAQDYTQWGLPDGAKARLGKGKISEIAYSQDGNVSRLQVVLEYGFMMDRQVKNLIC